MKLFSTLAAFAAVVAAQAPDGGVPAPAAAPPRPAPQVVSAAHDAGVAPASAQAQPQQQQPPQQQQQQPPPPRVVTVENTAKVQALEQKLDAQNAKLDATVKELETIRAQNAARDQAEQQRHARTEAQKQAATTIGNVDSQLMTGDTSQVLQSLSNIEGSLGPSAKANLENARNALANSDLANARLYLSRAAAEAQSGR